MNPETNGATNLRGARVLVTGGTRGIGAATVRRLAGPAPRWSPRPGRRPIPCLLAR